MKSTTTTLLAFFLLSAFISHLPSTALAADLVLDTDGDALRNGGTYYVITGNGGGIGTAATGNETCPLTVVQRPDGDKGAPITFTSLPNIRFIYEGFFLDVAFHAVPPCAPKPSKWTVVNRLPVGPAVKLTGYDNPLYGMFKIVKGYQLIFCAFPIEIGSCSGIGVYHDGEGNSRLVVTYTGKPLTVQFQKVTSSSA